MWYTGELCAFAFLYGLFAGGWSSTWVGISLEVQRTQPARRPDGAVGLAAAARGVGSIASGLISESLVGNAPGGVGWLAKKLRDLVRYPDPDHRGHAGLGRRGECLAGL